MDRHIPTNATTKKRRNFLKLIGIGAAGGLTLPSFRIDQTNYNRLHEFTQFQSEETRDEHYWEMVKKQFTVSPEHIMVNSANLCPCPYFVNEELRSNTSNLAMDVSFQNRNKFNEKRKVALEKMARYLGVQSKDLGITRNTSEANNIIINGLDFTPEDEVIIWSQNHPSNHVTWRHRAKRYGFKVKIIDVPAHPNSPEDLIRPFREAISPNTRLISFSHISNVSGLALPAQDICELARSNGIMTLIDGAQSFGFLNLDLATLGCSFYTASAHKWLMGPMENGILYVHPEYQEQLWPNIIAAGWKESSTSVDEKLCVLGQRNTPATATLPTILDFHFQIGKDHLESRVKELNTHFKNGLKETIPDVQFVTPQSEQFSGGVTIFNIPGKDPMKIFEKLYSDYGIAGAPTGGVRISPTINSTLDDMNKVIEAVGKIIEK